MICTGHHEVVRAICRALGIDNHANAHIVIDIKPGSIVKVFVEHYPTPDALALVAVELEQARRDSMIKLENVVGLDANIPDSSIEVKALPQ